MKKILIKLPSWAMFLILLIPFTFANNLPFGILLASFIWLLWLYFVGCSIYDKANSIKTISLKWFTGSLLYAICYIIVIEVIFKGSLPKVIIPFHLFAVCCIFGALFFVSRLLVMSEDKKIVKLNRCIGTFFLFWFFPIGVWFVHPRIKNVLLEP